MKYKGIRNKNRLGVYQVSKLLGISEETYKNVEKGTLLLSGEQLEKFKEIMSNSKDIRFNNLQLNKDIDDFVKSGQALEKLKDLGYSKKQLANILNISYFPVNKFFNDVENKLSFDFKLKIYDFLNNPLNKNVSWNMAPGYIEPVKEEEPKVDISEEPKEVNDNIEELKVDVSEEPKEVDYDYIIQLYIDEIKQLRKQVERYEKLIDLI